MVDAGKAVRGLGAVNVRRLSAGDISDAYTVHGKAEKQALYSVDTQGFDSVWSNDIKEIRAGYLPALYPASWFYSTASDHADL